MDNILRPLDETIEITRAQEDQLAVLALLHESLNVRGIEEESGHEYLVVEGGAPIVKRGEEDIPENWRWSGDVGYLLDREGRVVESEELS